MHDPYIDFWGDSDQSDIDYGVFPRARMHRKAWDQRLTALRLGRHICFGGKGGGSAPAPDPQIGEAAIRQAQTGQDWLNFARDQFDIGNARQAELDDLTKRVTEQQLSTQDQSNQWAKEDRARYKDVFQPLQDQYIQTAKDYNTPAKQEEMAAEAQADVQQGAKQANDANTRQMASMGINPASGRFQGITRAQSTLTGLQSAGAANTARQQVRDKALALQADAINVGSGLPSSAAQAAGLGLNAGNSATGNAVQANSNWRANVGIMGQGYQGAMQGYQGQANALNQQYGTQVQAWNAQQQASASNSAGLMSGIGAIAGAGIMAF